MMRSVLFCLFLFLTLISCTRSRQDERNGCAILAEVIQTIKKYESKPNQETSELVFKKAVELANYGTDMESVYEPCKEIANNMASVLECFYPDCEVFYCAAGRIKTHGEKHEKGKRLKSILDHVKVGELFLVDTYDQHRIEFRSPKEGIIIKMVMDDSVQNVIYIAQGDFQIPIISAERIGLLAEILSEAPSDNLIPTGVPLTSHIHAGNAPKIYNQVYNMVTAYFNVMLHVYRRFLRPNSDKVPNHVQLLYFKHSWSLFIPNVRNRRENLTPKFSQIKNLLYRPGQFIPGREDFLLTNEGKWTSGLEHASILLDYDLNRSADTLATRHAMLGPTVKLSPERQAQIDYLIQAYNFGKFKNFKGYADLPISILNDARNTLETHMSKPTSLLATTFRYHPAVELQQIPGLDKYVRKKAFESANRFESKKVIERVFKSELANCWNAFIPGSRDYFLEQLSQKGLTKCTCTEPFHPFTPDSPIGKLHKKFRYFLRRTYFFSKVEDGDDTLRDIPYFVEVPNIPILFDPNLTKRLLNLD